MKKLTKMIALAIGLVTVAFSGCKNILSDATIAGEGITAGSQITLYATSENDIITFSDGSARLIMPGTINGTTGYTFYLWGTDKLDSSNTSLKTPQVVTFTASGTSTTKGSVNLDLAVSQWELTLAVLPSTATAPATGDAAKKAAVLLATASVDFRSSDSVNFFLSPYKLSANGGFSLTVSTDGWNIPTTHTATLGIWPLNANDSDDTAVITGTTAKKELATLANTEYASTSTTSVAPGTYNFIVKLVPTSASGLTKTYYYSDQIVILSNQVTTADVKIPNILTNIPTDPENFGVGFVDPLTATADTYEVQFTWTDKSYNEDYFQIELLDFTNIKDADETTLTTSFSTLAAATGGADDTLDTAWAAIYGESYSPSETMYTIGKKLSRKVGSGTAEDLGYYYNNPNMWVSGSLNKNATYTVMSLKLGHRYLARMAAVNDIGKSKYLYAYIADETPTIENVEYNRYEITKVEATTVQKFGAGATEINRFRITYNLNEGTFYQVDTSTPKTLVTPEAAVKDITNINATGDAIVQYDTRRSAGKAATILNPLYAPSDTDGTYGRLYNGDMYRWTNWQENSTSGTIFALSDKYLENAKFDSATDTPDWTEAEYTGYANLDLYASYRVASGSVGIDESANYTITSNMVSVFYNTTNTFSADNKATATDGMYIFVNSTSEDNNAGTNAKAAKYLYVALVNDGTNNVVNETPVSYDKVVMIVSKTAGNAKKQTTTATSTPTTIDFTGKMADGSNSSSANASYVEIPIGTYAAGKYAVQIHAYADTQQSEYTYTIYFEVRDPSGV